MTRIIAFPRKRRRILFTAAGRALPGMFVLTLVVPTLIFARLGPEPMTLPAGTTFVVHTASDVSSKMPIGTRVEMRLESDLHIPGHFVSPAGTAVYGVVTRSEGGTRVGTQELAIAVNELRYKRQLVPLASDTVGLVAKPGVGSRDGQHITLRAGTALEVHLRTPVQLP